jgi:Family of unknown function (DUF6283)
MSEQGFRRKETCEECPWRKDVPVGRFPEERFISLRKTAEQGFNKPIFACHKTSEGKGTQACVGYLLVAGHNNFAVRLASATGRFDHTQLKATGPLYESYEEMARANGVNQDEDEENE